MKPIWREHGPWQNPIRSSDIVGSTALLVLDPHPGSLGGRIAGKVELRGPTRPATQAMVKVRCLLHTESVADLEFGDSSETHTLWESEQPVSAEFANGRVVCPFSFDSIPVELPESNLPLRGNVVEWELSVIVVAGDTKFPHAFAIPVFPVEALQHSTATGTRDIEDVVAKWRIEKTWQPHNAEVEADGDTLTLRLQPLRKGDVRRLVLCGLLFLLSLILLVGAAGMGDIVGIVVTGVFGVASLATAIGGVFISLRTVELRAQPGLISLHYSIRGRLVGTNSYRTEDISHIGAHHGGLHATLTEFGEVTLIKGIDDPDLLNEFRGLVRSALEPA